MSGGEQYSLEPMTRPLFALYVMWHPSFPSGREIADRLRTHFGRDLHVAIDEWRGVSVLERSAPVPGARTPLPINLGRCGVHGCRRTDGSDAG